MEKILDGKWIMIMENTQRDEDGETKVTINTEVMYIKDCIGRSVSRVIAYPEAEQEGMGDCFTNIHISGDQTLSIIRTGLFQSTLILQDGKRHFCNYKTPFGEVEFSVVTKYLENNLTDAGGSMRFRYQIFAQGGLLSDNQVVLRLENQMPGA